MYIVYLINLFLNGYLLIGSFEWIEWKDVLSLIVVSCFWLKGLRGYLVV